MRGKSGQFYLIAAVIIVGVLVGLAAVTNFVVERKTNDKLSDVNEELRLESQKVIEYGVANTKDIPDLLKAFAEKYVDYVGEGNDVLFIYGDEHSINELNQLYYVSLFKSGGSISLHIGASPPDFKIETHQVKQEIIPIDPNTNTVTIKIGNTNYDFELTEGKNFFFVVEQPITGLVEDSSGGGEIRSQDDKTDKEEKLKK